MTETLFNDDQGQTAQKKEKPAQTILGPKAGKDEFADIWKHFKGLWPGCRLGGKERLLYEVQFRRTTVDLIELILNRWAENNHSRPRVPDLKQLITKELRKTAGEAWVEEPGTEGQQMAAIAKNQCPCHICLCRVRWNTPHMSVDQVREEYVDRMLGAHPGLTDVQKCYIKHRAHLMHCPNEPETRNESIGFEEFRHRHNVKLDQEK